MNEVMCPCKQCVESGQTESMRMADWTKTVNTVFFMQSQESEKDDDTTNRALISVLDEFTRQQTTLSVDEVASACLSFC